jgi:hypothetical protein
VKLPNFTVTVTDKPVVGTLHHGHDVCWCVISLIKDNLLLNWMNFNFKDVTSLSIIDICKLPPADVAITASSNTVLTVKHDDFDEALVKALLGLCIADEVSLDKVAVPKNESTVLRTAKDFAIGEFGDTSNIRELELTELSDFTLKLETCEGLSHLPETDVATTASEQNVICVRRESNLVNFLGEGFCLKNNFLNDPVPDSDGIIGVATDTG